MQLNALSQGSANGVARLMYHGVGQRLADGAGAGGRGGNGSAFSANIRQKCLSNQPKLHYFYQCYMLEPLAKQLRRAVFLPE